MTVASSVNQSLATLKGIEAQLSIFALQSLDEDAKSVFHETMLIISEIKDDLTLRKNKLELEEPQYKSK